MHTSTACVPQLARIARLLGVDTTGFDDDTVADSAIAAVRRLRIDIGIPDRLRDIGCKEDQLLSFAETASGIKRIVRVNPRPITADDLEGILKPG